MRASDARTFSFSDFYEGAQDFYLTKYFSYVRHRVSKHPPGA